MKKRGFGLLETLIVIVVFLIGIGSSLIAINNILNNFTFLTNSFIAKNLAVANIEEIRNQRDNNLISVVGWNNNLINITDSISLNGVIFERNIAILHCPPYVGECIDIRANISWSDRRGEGTEIIKIRLFEY